MSAVEAELDAAKLLARLWTSGEGKVVTPVDPIYIAQQLGIEVFLAPLNDDTAGMLVKKSGRAAEIYLNAEDHPNRQRFTCAHEIGHYIKRTGDSDDQDWEFVDRRNHVSGKGVDAGEIYANQFAAALLMPAESMKRLAKQSGAPELAYEFQVSLEAVKHRLANLRRT